jgi:hypothetical protein
MRTAAVQRYIDQVLMGCMRRDTQSLCAITSDASLIDARSSLGFTSLYSACYTLWPYAVRQLLDAGADPFEVGFGSALDAVALGLRDAGRDVRSQRNARQIVAMVKERQAQYRRVIGLALRQSPH